MSILWFGIFILCGDYFEQNGTFFFSKESCHYSFVLASPVILPGKLTCPLKINGWKMYSLLKKSLFRGHVSFQGCIPCGEDDKLSIHTVGRCAGTPPSGFLNGIPDINGISHSFTVLVFIFSQAST